MRTDQNPPIGLYEKALSSSLEIGQKLQAAKNLGFDFFEISIDESDEYLAKLDWSFKTKRELIVLSQDLNLPIFSLCLSGHRRFSLGSSDIATRKKARDMLAKAIDLACDLNARVIQILGYLVYYEETTSKSKYHYLENLNWGVERAARNGVMLGIENVDSHKHINSITKAMEIVKEINSPWLQLYSDFANLAAFGFDIPSELEIGKGHFIAMHIKDVIPNEVRGIQFGKGMVDFQVALNKLVEIGYHGPLLLETWHDKNDDSCSVISRALLNLRNQLIKSNYNLGNRRDPA